MTQGKVRFFAEQRDFGAMAATDLHLADMRAMAMGALRKAGAIE